MAAAQSDSEISVSWEASPDASVAGYEVYRGETPAWKVTALRAVDRGLRHGTRFCYAIRAFDAEGNVSEPTSPVCAQTLDTTPPTAPPKVQVGSGAANQVVVRWAASTDDVGVVRYEVFRGTDLLASVVDGTSLVVNHVPILKEQCYTVRAYDRAGNRSESTAPACITLPDVTPPTVPGQVVARAKGEHEVVVNWEASTDDVGVARYEAVRTSGKELEAVALAVEGTGARDRSLSASTRYCYTVRACDGSGNCSATSPAACATTPDLTPPSVPQSAAAKALSDTAIEVRWAPSTDNVGVAGYELRRGDKVVVADAKDTVAREGLLHPSVEYCYTVIAFDAAGNRSPPSAAACARPPDLKPPSVPDRVGAVSVSSTQVFVAWDPATDDVGVAGYEVLRGGKVIARVATTRARERALQSNQEYCYSVVAFDAAGNRSSSSASACTTTADPSQLTSPSDLRVVRSSATVVMLQWEPSEEPGVLYRVYSEGKSVGLTKSNTFTPSGRLGGKSNCYRVAAVDAQGRESPRSNEVCARGDLTASASK